MSVNQSSLSCGLLHSGDQLTSGQSNSSCDGTWTLKMEPTGNLVLYANTNIGTGDVFPRWQTNTFGAAVYAVMQGDGNLVVYSGAGALWNSATYNNANAYLAIQNDGNLVIYSSGGTSLWSRATPVKKTLNDYWAGTARWQLAGALTYNNGILDSGEAHGSHMTIGPDGTWYFFIRYFVTPPSDCMNVSSFAMGVSVRRSTNRGATWSAPANILPNGTAGIADHCVLTDGDAIYDSGQNQWHYVSQCMGSDGIWNGCAYRVSGADPTARNWAADGAQPVVPSGSQWSQICASPASRCYQLTGSATGLSGEGTFSFFNNYDPSYYWIAFHGVSSNGKTSARGWSKIAKSNVHTWYPMADDIFDRNLGMGSLEAWSNPVGNGAGNVLFDNGYYYQVVETVDAPGSTDGLGTINTPTQHWDLSLVRSADLSTWTQPSVGNPVMFSSTLGADAGRGEAAYPRLFKDVEGNTYLGMTRRSVDAQTFGYFMYMLVPTNLLFNSDLWTCSMTSWTGWPGSNWMVYRAPANSSDRGCYLEANQGTAGSAGSFYQDVAVSTVGGKTAVWGGKFRAWTSGTQLNVVLWELGSNHAPIVNHNFVVYPATNYASYSTSFVGLSSQTAYLRFQPYLLTANVNYDSDEMFLNVQ